MDEQIQEKLVKKGAYWLDSLINGNVGIFETNFKPGTHHSWDLKKDAEDQFGKFFLLSYSSSEDPENYDTVQGYYASLEDATDAANGKFKDIKWEK